MKNCLLCKNIPIAWTIGLLTGATVFMPEINYAFGIIIGVVSMAVTIASTSHLSDKNER